MERIIFTSGANIFYEIDDAYKLVNQKENFVILDKNEKMLLKITELLQKKLALYFNSGNGAFYFSTYENGEVRYYCSLRQFVVAFNMGGNFEENLNVVKSNSDKMNCCQNNLVWMKARDNIRKGNLTKKLNQAPFRCKLVSSKYGIQMEAGYIDESYGLKIISNYENPSDFVDALRNFWKSGILQDDYGREYKLPQVPERYFKEKMGVNE